MSDGAGAPAVTDTGAGSTGTGTDGVVTVSEVAVSFGEVSVLSGVSMGIERGEVVCLVGANGSGKTTLLRVVAGLLDPDAGTVTIDADADRPVGYLPQSPAFDPAFTVRETLSFYASLAGGVDVEDRLAAVGLAPVADRRVDALSGGMVRLLGLAQATVGDPPVLVLDEPAGGLDPVVRRHVDEHVRAIADEGTAVLVATHDLVGTERIADSVAVLSGGSLLERGDPDSVRAAGGTDSFPAAVEALLSPDDGEVRVSAGVRSGGGDGD